MESWNKITQFKFIFNLVFLRHFIMVNLLGALQAFDLKEIIRNNTKSYSIDLAAKFIFIVYPSETNWINQTYTERKENLSEKN